MWQHADPIGVVAASRRQDAPSRVVRCHDHVVVIRNGLSYTAGHAFQEIACGVPTERVHHDGVLKNADLRDRRGHVRCAMRPGNVGDVVAGGMRVQPRSDIDADDPHTAAQRERCESRIRVPSIRRERDRVDGGVTTERGDHSPQDLEAAAKHVHGLPHEQFHERHLTMEWMVWGSPKSDCVSSSTDGDSTLTTWFLGRSVGISRATHGHRKRARRGPR